MIRETERNSYAHMYVCVFSGGARPEMHPEARKLLVDFYKPWNEALDMLLGSGGSFTKGWA